MRRGLTLIELLITIVIMVTVLAAILPLVSPNNNSRKIREASRQLNSLCAQAKAMAAAEGRPFGVAFTEFGTATPFSGMALEAYIVAEPRPFAGYSESSQVRFFLDSGQIVKSQFVLAGNFNPAAGPPPSSKDYDPSTYQSDIAYFTDDVPPRYLRLGDTIRTDRFTLRITDLDQDADGQADDTADPPFKGGDFYVTERSDFTCQPLTPLSGQAVLPSLWPHPLSPGKPFGPNGWTNPVPYKIERQYTKSSQSPLQFPRGVGIDMQASGADRDGSGIPYYSFDASGATAVAVMFSPTGSVSDVYMDGVRLQDVDQVYLLLGLFENGNGNSLTEEFDFDAYPPADEAEIAERRGRINWLNPDSRWVTINKSSGRVATADNAFINVLEAVDLNGNGEELPGDWRDQVGASRRYAKDMSGGSSQ